MEYSTSAILESLQITNIAKNEINEIKQEVYLQNDRLLNIQKMNSNIYDLLKDNNQHIDCMFKKSKIGYYYIGLFAIIFILIIILLKIIMF